MDGEEKSKRCGGLNKSVKQKRNIYRLKWIIIWMSHLIGLRRERITVNELIREEEEEDDDDDDDDEIMAY